MFFWNLVVLRVTFFQFPGKKSSMLVSDHLHYDLYAHLFCIFHNLCLSDPPPCVLFFCYFLATWLFACDSLSIDIPSIGSSQSTDKHMLCWQVSICPTITYTHRAGHLLISCTRVEWGSLQEICHSSLGCYHGIKDLGNLSSSVWAWWSQWLSGQAWCYS